MARKKQVAPKAPKGVVVDTDGMTTFHTYGEGVIEVYEEDEETKLMRRWVIRPHQHQYYLRVITRAEEILAATDRASMVMTPEQEKRFSDSFYRTFEKHRKEITGKE